jgi:hypothetical protein
MDVSLAVEATLRQGREPNRFASDSARFAYAPPVLRLRTSKRKPGGNFTTLLTILIGAAAIC